MFQKKQGKKVESPISKSSKQNSSSTKRPAPATKSIAAPLLVSTKSIKSKYTTKDATFFKSLTKSTKKRSSGILDSSEFDDEISESENLVIEKTLELPELLPEEEELFEAVTASKIVDVKHILTSMDANTLGKLSSKWNDEGDTVFHVAIRREDEEMVDFMVDYVPNLDNLYYDLLLLAVKESNVEITQILLDAIRKKPGYGPSELEKLSDLPRWQNSEFDEHMTPIMLAAIVGNYDLIAMFVAEGEKLEPKLTYSSAGHGMSRESSKSKGMLESTFCCCRRRTDHREDIIDDYQRYHEYQALTSPEMICFMANTTPKFDPLLKAFEYISELRQVRDIENEFRENYIQMINGLNEFAVQLVSMCESSKELNMLLSRPEGYHGKNDRYPRVILAMEMGLRDFVAHPHTQGLLYTQWAGQYWNEWRYFSNSEKIWQFIRRVIFLPLFLLFVFGEQGNRHGKLLASPINRCFYSCVSQMIFVGLAVTEHILEISQPSERLPPNMYIEFTLAVFVAGHIRGLLRQFFYAPKAFFQSTWNWYDMANCTIFCICFLCWGILYFEEWRDTKFLFRKREPLQRQYWKFYDPLMIADVFLALGTIMACGKLMRYVQLHGTIGPIQIALGKMIKNILNFILFFAVVLSSFTLGITMIYAPYRGLKDARTGEGQGESFTSHKNTLTEMFWNLFGMSDAGCAELVTISIKDATDEGHVDHYEHLVTEVAGKTLYSVYSFFGATILFSSLLVAYISNTFGEIVEENEINWKFNRAQLWIYFSRSSVMPSPFNLIPTLWDVISIFRTIRDIKRHPKKYTATCNCAVCYHKDTRFTPEEERQRDLSYFNLVKLLIQRYFRSKTALEGRAPPSSEFISSLGEEVEELKALIDEAVDKIKESDRGVPVDVANNNRNVQQRSSLPVALRQSPSAYPKTFAFETSTSVPTSNSRKASGTIKVASSTQIEGNSRRDSKFLLSVAVKSSDKLNSDSLNRFSGSSLVNLRKAQDKSFSGSTTTNHSYNSISHESRLKSGREFPEDSPAQTLSSIALEQQRNTTQEVSEAKPSPRQRLELVPKDSRPEAGADGRRKSGTQMGGNSHGLLPVKSSVNGIQEILPPLPPLPNSKSSEIQVVSSKESEP